MHGHLITLSDANMLQLKECNIFRYIIQIGSIRRKVTKNRDFMPKCCVNNFYAQAEKIDV